MQAVKIAGETPQLSGECAAKFAKMPRLGIDSPASLSDSHAAEMREIKCSKAWCRFRPNSPRAIARAAIGGI
jgi:hypothetical protein